MLFSGDSTRPPLAHSLTQAMRSQLRHDGEGGLIAPGHYLVHIHPQNLPQWSDAEFRLSSFLQESARDAGISFETVPVIRLFADPALSSQEIRIEIPDSQVASGYTSTIRPESTSHHKTKHSPASPVNAYLIVNGGDLFALNLPVTNIGRRSDNHLAIDDPRVSRRHCQLRLVQHNYVLFDLNSTGGTFVNNIRVSRQTLKAGDVISLGGAQLIYGEDSAAQGQTNNSFLDDQTANLKKDGASS